MSLSVSPNDMEVESDDISTGNYEQKEAISSESVILYVFIFISGISMGALATRYYTESGGNNNNIARIRRPEL